MNPESSLVPLRTVGSGKPLFLIHGVDGEVTRFSALVDHLRTDRPIYGVRSQVLLRGTRARMRVEDQAAFYVEEIRAVQPRGPYHLLGFSFGGLVALEIAQQLHAQGQECALVGAVDNLRMRPMRAVSSAELSSQETQRTDLSSAPARRKGGLADHIAKVFSSGGLLYAWTKLEARGLRTIYTILDRFGQPIPAVIRRSSDVNWFAAVRYVPRPYPGSVTLFQSESSALEGKSTDDLWTALAGGGVEICRIPGTHETLFSEPNVSSLASAIDASLAKLDRMAAAPAQVQNAD